MGHGLLGLVYIRKVWKRRGEGWGLSGMAELARVSIVRFMRSGFVKIEVHS